MKHIFLLLNLILLFCPTFSHANTITGKVISVADGDTITTLNGSQQTKIRLYGIDTPEKAQAFGNKAKNFTVSLTAGKQVSVKVYDTDRYGRSVGVVIVDGTNVNQEIIRAGYAWQYRKYCKKNFCDDWLRLEKQSRNNRIGLWKDNNPVAPWEWRKNKRSGGKKNNVVGGSGICMATRKVTYYTDQAVSTTIAKIARWCSNQLVIPPGLVIVTIRHV